MIYVTSTALHLFGLTIHWYGLIIAVGIVLAILLAARREARLNLPRETTLDLALVCIPVAVVCARLYFVIFSWETYADDPVRALYIWEGGMAIYGGILGGLLAGGLYARAKRISFFRLTDLVAPSLALGQAIGRWGNFVNQEAYGAVVTAQWQRFFPLAVWIEADGQWHYATFFYESAWCALIVAALLWAERRRLFRRPGDIFFSYVLLYGLERALVEGLRTDSLYLGPIRVSQALSLLAMLAAALILCLRVQNGRRWGAAMVACCALMALILIAGHAVLALIPGVFIPICAAAMYIKEDSTETKTTDKAMIE